MRRLTKIVTSALAFLSFGAAIAGEALLPEASNASTVSLNIKAQPLGDALSAFAIQTGLQVVYYSKVEEGLRAPALNGNYSLQEALKQLLVNISATPYSLHSASNSPSVDVSA